jgi:hypothetical protein
MPDSASSQHAGPLPLDPGQNTWTPGELLVLLAAAVYAVMATYQADQGDLASSRLATVFALVHDGAFYIDRPSAEPPNPFERRTVDKVMVKGEPTGAGIRGGRLVSSKPPVLPLIMTGEYLVLNRLFGWRITRAADIPQILTVMTVTLVGLSYAGALWLFLKTLRLLGAPPHTRTFLVFLLAFASPLWGYSTTMNNHVPAAFLLLGAVYLAAGMGMDKLAPRPWRFTLFGLCSALVFTVDLPATVWAGLATLFLLVRYPRQTLTWGLAGAAAPLVVHFAVMIAVTGSPLPVQMRPETYLWEGAYWRHPMGIDALNQARGEYLFHMTFGRNGLFALHPILIAGLVATVRALVRRDMAWRPWILGGALGFAVLTAYYASSTNNYGGESYGFRWYITAVPVLLLMAAPVFSGLRGRWRWVFVGLMVGVSFFSAWESTHAGWRSNTEWTCLLLGPHP